jgi:hypothetical protein
VLLAQVLTQILLAQVLLTQVLLTQVVLLMQVLLALVWATNVLTWMYSRQPRHRRTQAGPCQKAF